MSMGTGIYSAAPQWARIGVIMVVGSWHDALAADQLPREIVGNWCVAIKRMLPGKTYTYWRCKDSNWDIIVRWDGFDAQESALGLADDFANGIIAKQIVELARAGERHPDVLCEGALKKLRGHLFGD